MFNWPKVYIVTLLATCFVYTANLQAKERDPFVSIIDMEESSSAIKKIKINLSNVVLKGIIWNNSRAIAIINEELVMPGDDFGGYKVERIDKDSVTLRDEEKSYRLFLELEEVSARDKEKASIESEEPQIKERLGYPEGMPPGAGGEFYPDEGFLDYNQKEAFMPKE